MILSIQIKRFDILWKMGTQDFKNERNFCDQRKFSNQFKITSYKLQNIKNIDEHFVVIIFFCLIR